MILPALAGSRADPAGAVPGRLPVLVAAGVTFVVATGSGKVMSFEHVYPTIHSK